MPLFRILMTTAVVTAFAFSFHVLYGEGWVNSVINAAARQGHFDNLLKPPYPPWVVVVAASTALLPTAFKILAYYFAGGLLPFKNRLMNGLLYGFLLLAVSDGLIRFPIMNLIVGNPVYIVSLQSSESWMINIATGIIIAAIGPVRSYETTSRLTSSISEGRKAGVSN